MHSKWQPLWGWHIWWWEKRQRGNWPEVHFQKQMMIMTLMKKLTGSIQYQCINLRQNRGTDSADNPVGNQTGLWVRWRYWAGNTRQTSTSHCCQEKRQKISERKLKEKLEKHKQLSNCRISVPRINQQILALLDQNTRTAGLCIQKEQKCPWKQPVLFPVSHAFAENASVDNKGNLKDVTSSLTVCRQHSNAS